MDNEPAADARVGKDAAGQSALVGIWCFGAKAHRTRLATNNKKNPKWSGYALTIAGKHDPFPLFFET
jgi:hypothetical protein